MRYILNFFDGNGLPSHCVHMDCKDDLRAIALVELVSVYHEMELCQGDRIVRVYRGKPLPMFSPSPLEFRRGADVRQFHSPVRGGYGR